MSKLLPDFTELQAYVDSELDNIRAGEIAELIAANPQLASQVSDIRGLKQSVASAINNLPLSDTDHLRTLAELQTDSTSNTGLTRPSNDGLSDTTESSSIHSSKPGEPTGSATRLDIEDQRPHLFAGKIKTAGIALAATFAGVLIGLMLSSTRQPPQNKVSWINQVASYHDMYTNATLAAVETSLPSELENKERYEAAMGEALAAPDLSTLGFQFKRAQLLQSDNKPVVQFAYLDENTSTPLAFCITVAEGEGQKKRTGQAHGVNYVNWRSSTLDYVVLGKLPHEQLQQMAMLAQSTVR